MNFHHYKTLDSTNDHLHKMAENGAPEWTVVMADRQRSGRGRHGRDWWSPVGNLHVSILLKPEVSPTTLLRLPVIASLALVDAMGKAGSTLSLKWPNDILLNGRKMAGILAESKIEGHKVLWVVVGFGVNMVRTGGSIPEDLQDRMAFVCELDESIVPGELAARITLCLKERSGAMQEDRWNEAMDQWSQRAILHTPYIHRDGGREIEGVPLRLDESGGLVMETKAGEVTVYSGELEESIQNSTFNI